MITYQTAWLRTHYPYEFFAASMSLEKNDTDKLAEFIIEAKSQSIKINSPDTNNANVKLTNGTITFDTHHGTFDLSTTILLITLHQPLTALVHVQ